MLHHALHPTRQLLVALLALGALLALTATAVLGDQTSVELNKTFAADPQPVPPGDTVTYTVVATIIDNVDDLVIFDGSLDPGQMTVQTATWVATGSSAGSGTCLIAGDDVDCQFDALSAGTVVTVTIEVLVAADPDVACPDRGDGSLDTNMTNRARATWIQGAETFTIDDPETGVENAVNVGIDCSTATPAARPETSISSGPSGTVASTTAEFAFTATNTPTSFECMLDSGAWEVCTSPKSYTSLTDGSHTFQVRGINLAGEDLTPASRTWTVDSGTPPPPPPPDDEHPFTDIGTSQFENDIIWLYNEGITGGCTTTLFCPNSNVLRDQMASFLDRALDLPATAIDFFDDDDGSIHEGAINRLAAAGITGGCDVREYCPKASVKRDQMASFLVRAFNLPVTATDFFGDDEGNLHENQINALANSGITGGCGPGTYCPTNPVTRGQMAAFLHRASD